MRIFWKIFAFSFLLFIAVVLLIFYLVLAQQKVVTETNIIEENRIIGRILARQLEKDYLEMKWPFVALNTVAEHDDFLFWWVVRNDDIIHLADDAGFMKTRASHYFPQLSPPGPKERLYLDRTRNCGILVFPLQMGQGEWSLWLGFSLRGVQLINKRIIFGDSIIFFLALGIFGIVLFLSTTYLTKPLKALTANAQIIGQGDLSHRAEVKTADELGELAQAFNQMAAALQEREMERRMAEAVLRETEAQLRTSLKEKEVLLNEVHHRVKNNLQIVSSFLNLSKNQTKHQEAINILDEAQGRIHNMAMIHRQLYQNREFGRIDMLNHAQVMLDYLARMFSKRIFIEKRIIGQPLYLALNQAIPCSMALLELMLNAAKHAVEPGEKMHLTIALDKVNDRRVCISVKDDGKGLPPDFDWHKLTTTGLEITRDLVEKQLQGCIYHLPGPGAHIVLEFEVTEIGEKYAENTDS